MNYKHIFKFESSVSGMFTFSGTTRASHHWLDLLPERVKSMNRFISLTFACHCRKT